MIHLIGENSAANDILIKLVAMDLEFSPSCGHLRSRNEMMTDGACRHDAVSSHAHVAVVIRRAMPEMF